jgi:hypothetical protein
MKHDSLSGFFLHITLGAAASSDERFIDTSHWEAMHDHFSRMRRSMPKATLPD